MRILKSEGKQYTNRLFDDTARIEHYRINENLTPLPVMVKKEAAQSAIRMLDSFILNTGDMQGHIKIYEDFQMDLHALSDKMPIRYDFEFEVKIYESDKHRLYTKTSDSTRKRTLVETNENRK
jgi:hypothetical protein